MKNMPSLTKFAERGCSSFRVLGPAILISLVAATALAQTKIQARDSDSFVDTMGVNVHVESVNTPYGDYAGINERLRLLGMRHVRDEINDTDPSFVAEMQQIGRLGYMLCGLIEGGNDYPPPGDRLQARDVLPMVRHLKPVIEALEGPNEPDNVTFLYHGVHYPQGAINESEDLWNILKGASETRHLPVLAMSESRAEDFTALAAVAPPPNRYATFGNMHAYQGGSLGDNLLSDWFVPYARVLTRTEPLWTTEMGYHTNIRYLSDGEQQGVSPRASAIYLPVAFLSGFNHRVLRTFSYELIDEADDPHFESGSGEGHYGILNYDGIPKPAYTALANLISILREPGHKYFSPGSLTISFLGAPGTMRYTLLQKSTGVYYLALWNDVSVYQVATESTPGKDLYPANVPITLILSAPGNFRVYAPNDASGVHLTGAYTLGTASNAIRLDLSPNVLILEISG